MEDIWLEAIICSFALMILRLSQCLHVCGYLVEEEGCLSKTARMFVIYELTRLLLQDENEKICVSWLDPGAAELFCAAGHQSLHQLA